MYIYIDTPVVVLDFENFKFEIQPVLSDYEKDDELRFTGFQTRRTPNIKRQSQSMNRLR